MLRVLLESRALRQRRSGGMVLSVAAHLAIVGAVAAATVPKPARHKPEPAVVVHITPPRAASPVQRRAHTSGGSPAPFARAIEVDRFSIPTFNLSSLPPIDPGLTSSDTSTIAIGRSAGPAGPRSIIDGGGGGTSDTEWRGDELIMRIVTSATPRYPDALRRMGLDGRVLIRFVIDTTGRINDASVKVVESSHELFTRSVRDVLARFRFKPAEVGGRRVSALAEMPFEFRITK